jgi:hypothetical protein
MNSHIDEGCIRNRAIDERCIQDRDIDSDHIGGDRDIGLLRKVHRTGDIAIVAQQVAERASAVRRLGSIRQQKTGAVRGTHEIGACVRLSYASAGLAGISANVARRTVVVRRTEDLADFRTAKAAC